jgi:hypothetical protein
VVVGLAVLLLAGVAVTLIVTSGTNSAKTNAVAARRLVHSALTATIHGRSFHYVSRFTTKGQVQTTVGDAEPDSGRQVITIGSDTFTVLVIGTACYFKGDAAQIVAQLGLPTSVASAHAGQWISLAPGDLPYQSVYVAVTTRSALDSNIAFTPRQEIGTSNVNGLRVVGITGPLVNQTVDGQVQRAKGTAMLYVTTSRPHLPVQYTENGDFGTTTSNLVASKLAMTFSKWGETVTVHAPKGAVPYASLGGGNGSVPNTGPPVLTSAPL